MKIVPLARKARKVSVGRELNEKPQRRPMRWVAIAVVFVLTVLVTSPFLWREPLPTEAGQAIHEPIHATTSFSYQEADSQQRWEEKLWRETVRVFQYNAKAADEGVKRLSALLGEARAIGDDQELDRDTIRQRFQAVDVQTETWSDEELETLVRLAREERFREGLMQAVREIYTRRLIATPPDSIRYQEFENLRRVLPDSSYAPRNAQVLQYPDETDQAIRILLQRLLATPILDDWAEQHPAETKAPEVLQTTGGELAMEMLQISVKPNLVFDQAATEKESERLGKPQPRVIAKGFLIAPQNPAAMNNPLYDWDKHPWPHFLTEQEASYLRAYTQDVSFLNLKKFGAQILFVLIAFLIVSFFVIKFSRELEFNTNTVLLLSLPVLLALALGRLFLVLGGDAASYAGYAFPAGVIGILGVLLLDVRLAILMVTWGCLLFGLEANLEYEFVIVGLFGGYTAVAALYTFRERREVLYAGLLIGFVNASTILILHYISESERDVWTAAAIGAMGGVMCSLISFAVLPVFEVAFHIVTDMRLLELCGLQHPLLKRMEEVAPGTLQHTMNVAKLAESAASAIGVNYLLVRAGCYFHDIGKMDKPEYFTENQVTPEDKRRHTELKPQMSTLIIKNHVKEGIEMAREYKLPKVVADFIPEHHGTSLIQYFYHKALSAQERGETKEPVREEDYRYPGPKPQSIESAIVMLADTVEATATAKLSGRTVREDDIQMLVRNAISEKFNDSQFDNCNLTMRDLNAIRESFVRTLRSRFHARIDYPSMPKRDTTSREPRKERETEKSSQLSQPAPPGAATAPASDSTQNRPSRDMAAAG